MIRRMERLATTRVLLVGLSLLTAFLVIAAFINRPDAPTAESPTRGSDALGQPVASVPGGDPATWYLRSDQRLDRTTRSFTASVMRLDCHGGITGTVLTPSVSTTARDVVITFTVGPKATPGTIYSCPTNRAERYVVHLPEPLGRRNLIDGQCIGGKVPKSRFRACGRTATRWRDGRVVTFRV